ncbi:hypothetical protein CVT26_012761 [Gymnopilus dilepis]|uniref:CxC2-like cysteine cluster KDZ transposase-associated domain-containing protein n=1 Tax=Gymnopilus dilepis TaxID=231916 RepID=A0A409WDM8_9AGAR|nr:hypothetical protein CVT26_012761 [Gymnopilus dilepis]
MQKHRPSQNPYDKRKRSVVHRTRASIIPEQSSSTAPLQPIRVKAREERLQQSRGAHYESSRITVPQNHWMPLDNTELGLDADSTSNDAALDTAGVWEDVNHGEEHTQKKKKGKTLKSKRPMVFWKEAYRDFYLDEMLRWEGRGDAWADGQSPCSDCCARSASEPAPGEYRCLDCFYPHMLCGRCCVRRHRMQPLHLIEKWTGSSFVKSSLKVLGLRVQLNHLSMSCSKPEPCHSSFVILHTNGLHEVAVDFCNCRPVSKFRQLLRRGLYPASQDNPRTCATFTLLRQMHMLGLTSKCSAYDFYRSLEKMTDNTGINVPTSRYRPLMRMALQWRHLKLLKRGGRGHDSTGAKGTKEGELALVCPSCPHPGINIPDDWSKASEEERFLYFVFLCIDANFRLKNQLVSNYSTDPGLGIGWAYMIAREPYEDYVKSRANDLDVRYGFRRWCLDLLTISVQDVDSKGCGLQAVDKAHTKFNKGLRYTGVSSVSCGRSEMLLPCSVGNLQKGERYSNMDFACGSAMRFVAILLIVLSYDIACHWFVNLFRRINTHWPSNLKPRQGTSLSPLIPKMHEPGHQQKKGHEQFSCNLFKGAGQTDCEVPERIWSGNNAVANSTKTMGPGSRHDVLDDHFGFWNYEKYVGMGVTLLRRFRKAVPERNRQTEAHRGFSASIELGQVAEWTQMCVEWEMAAYPKDKVDNPYHVEGSNLTQAQVQKELAEEEEHLISSGGSSLHEMSPSDFLIAALNLEESQRRLAVDAATKDHDGASLREQREALRKSIDKWKRIQPVYMPGLMQYLQSLERKQPGSTLESEKIESIKLWLPSDIAKGSRDWVCTPGLATSEEKLREAQCYDALDNIRNVLRLKTRMVQFKNKNIRGQRSGTRSRVLIDRVHRRARRLAAEYRTARAAKLALSGPGEWQKTLQELRDSDVRAYQDPDRVKERRQRKGTYEDHEHEEADAMAVDSNAGAIDLLPEDRTRRNGTGQSHKVLSWIWIVEKQGTSTLDMGDVLRSEWARSRARAARATEEVALLKEEMRRVLAYLDWKADWWKGRQSGRQVQDKALEEGLLAFCVDQESRQRALRASFQKLWTTPLSDPTPGSDGDGKGGSNGGGGGGGNNESGGGGNSRSAGIEGGDDYDSEDSDDESDEDDDDCEVNDSGQVGNDDENDMEV